MKAMPWFGFIMWLLFIAVYKSAFAQAGKQQTLKELVLCQAPPASFILQQIHMGELLKAGAVCDKVQNAFDKTFVHESTSDWYALDKKYKLFGVRFLNNDQYAIAVFTKRGNLVYAVVSIPEKELDRQVCKIIRSNYADDTITNVLKVTTGFRDIYLVQLQDGNHVASIYVENGCLNVLQEYTITVK